MPGAHQLHVCWLHAAQLLMYTHAIQERDMTVVCTAFLLSGLQQQHWVDGLQRVDSVVSKDSSQNDWQFKVCWENPGLIVEQLSVCHSMLPDAY